MWKEFSKEEQRNVLNEILNKALEGDEKKFYNNYLEFNVDIEEGFCNKGNEIKYDKSVY